MFDSYLEAGHLPNHTWDKNIHQNAYKIKLKKQIYSIST